MPECPYHSEFVESCERCRKARKDETDADEG